MRQFVAFTQKELLEHSRTHRIFISIAIFIIFGIANPAVAKLTPLILEQSAKTLADAGITVAEIEITAMNSWTQFISNTSTVLAAFLVLFCGSFTREYRSGTLIPLISKGLRRSTVVNAKTFVLILFWSIGFWSYFGITYGYTELYWDQSGISSIFFTAGCWWLLGVFWICMLVFLSSFLKSSVQVIATMAGIYLGISTLKVLKVIQVYMPTHLEDSQELLSGKLAFASYLPTIVITTIVSLLFYIFSLLITRNKQF